MRILRPLLRGLALAIPAVSALNQEPIISFSSGLALAGSGLAPNIRLDTKDWPGVIRAARDLAADFGRVGSTAGTVWLTGTSTRPANTGVIIAGTIGRSTLIDELVSSGKLDVSKVRGQWESFVSAVVDSPADGVSSALVIAGSDKRGTIFGLYDVSEQIGVSPLYWWADVPAKKATNIYAIEKVKVQGPPSVKYRGIFLNDEQPALTNWVRGNYPNTQYGPGFNSNFHARVFELLLRLRANYFWPAMWDSMFYVDDSKNGPQADEWGIVMGTTHTEPLARATKEQKTFLGGSWDWVSNQNGVKRFLQEGATRAKSWETVWTLGMRGDHDTANPALNTRYLEEIITFQQSTLRSTLATQDLTKVPQMWCLYKEVGGYYQNGMKVPDDVTLLWSDDNVGNVQRVPLKNETGRGGRAGVYFHIDYVGDPRNYKWINSIQLSKTWEQMYLAFHRAADRIWILNVGDLKANELPINHFLDMAYDMSYFEAPESNDAWLKSWATREFGAQVADATAEIMATYGKLIVRRKYELLNANPAPMSTINYDEAQTVLQEWTDLVAASQKVHDSLDSNTKISYWEVVHHPVSAGKTVQEIYIKASLNALYTRQHRSRGNNMANDVRSAFSNDQALTRQFHTILNGKWNHMMDQVHLGYTNWQDPGSNSMPSVQSVNDNQAPSTGIMGVSVQGSDVSVPGATAPQMWGVSPYKAPKDTRFIEIYTRSTGSFTWTAQSNASYVKIDPSSGSLTNTGTNDVRANVTVDWDAAPSGQSTANIVIQRSGSGTTSTTLTLPINKVSVPSGFKGHVESNGVVSIEAGHFTSKSEGSAGASYITIPNYGRTLNGVTIRPVTAPSMTTSTAPKLSYPFHAFTSNARATVTFYLSPSWNVDPSRPMKYAFAVDGGSATTVQPVPNAALGQPPSGWSQAVQDGAWQSRGTINVPAGSHTLDVWHLEPGIAMQKIVIDLGGVKASYLGPPESFRV